MVGKTCTATVIGITAQKVEVEADIASGIPSFELTGNLGTTAREARYRVRTALRNSGVKLHPARITVNLSPANIRKEGPHFDLAIAVSVLASYGIIDVSLLESTFFLGELALDGNINPVRAVLPMVMCARDNHMTRCIVPKENAAEAVNVTGITVIGVTSLKECIAYLRGNLNILPTESVVNSHNSIQDEFDFSEIRGQRVLKRAVMVAASSMHNILMVGPPGTGKTMTAARINTILPPLTDEQCIEISGIYSVAGLLNNEMPFIDKRPFRSPHNSITMPAMTGGGANPLPGEISLAQHGVLFMDEFNLFSKSVTESLREPLENNYITVNRVHGIYKYPANFMLVAAINPCVCGYYPDRTKCHCTDKEIKSHFGKISKPIMDRIDIFIQSPKLLLEDIESNGADSYNGSSEFMREKVRQAYEIQKERYSKEKFDYNSNLPSNLIKKYCVMEPDAAELLKAIYGRYDLSARTYFKIMKVARTIADVDGNEKITIDNMSEAIGYKGM